MKASFLRTAWIILCSFGYTAFACSVVVLARLKGPLSRPWVDKKMQRWVDVLLSLIRVDFRVHNPHQTKINASTPTIIMCNHSSLYDIPLSIKAFPKHSIRMLAKKELSKVPFMGQGMKAAEFPFIDRKNRNQAIKDLVYARSLMESGILLWIAPEGTRSKDGKLGPFKKGPFITAIQSKATIIPIGINGAHDILPAKSHHIRLHQKAEIYIGKPIDASQYTIDNKQALIDVTRNQFLQLIKSPQNK